MPTMDAKTIEDFLTTPNRHAIVGTNRRDRAPHLSPVWYVYDGGTMYVSIREGCVKHRNLQRDPSISVCVDGGRQDVRTVTLYGTAEIKSADDPSVEEMRWRIIRAYYPTDEAARAYYESVRDMPTVLIALKPEKVSTQDFND